MADEKKPESPEYSWLYAGRHGGKEGDAVGSPPASPATTPPPPAGASGGDPEATQMIDRRPGGASAQAADHTQVIGEDRPAAGRPTSFGGTYAAPPRPSNDGPRFAAPVTTDRPPGQPPTKPPTKQKPPKRPGSRRKWWIRGILALVLVWVLFLVLVPIWAWSKIDKVDATPSGSRPAATSGTNYLLVGSDARAGLAGARTDTILLLHIPDGGGPNLLLSFPRDSYVDIPNHGKNKLNAAYSFGGPKLLVQTIEANTKIHVDDYIEIGFTGLVDVVDAVGGIEVCPKQSINDPKAGHLRMQRGCQTVDGQTALGYSRSRHFANGDITRTEHQREVITQVGKKAASWSTIVLPWRYFKVNKAGGESLRIGDDVGPIDLAKFAWAMAHSGEQKRCVVPFSSLSFSAPDGQSAVLWDQQKSSALFQSIRDDDTSGAVCDATGQR